MNTYTLYDTTTLALVPSVVICSAEALAALPEGTGAVLGRWDAQRYRVLLIADDFGQLVPGVVANVPPRPADNAIQSWVWDETNWSWVPQHTEQALGLLARIERDARMTATDWVAARSAETGEPIPQAWLEYRQALRDLPEQAGFPTAITWPTPPNE